MAYVNPLHPPVPSSSRSQFSSLGGAVPQATPPFRRRVPQPAWKSVAGTSLQSPVSFDYLGFTGKGHGVPMQDLVARSTQALAQMVDRADERVNIRSAAGQMMLRIKWPGYEHLEWMHPIDLASAPTRSRLGAAVSFGFMRNVETNRPGP